MATANLTSVGGFLKKFYIGPIRDQLNNASVLDSQWKVDEEVSGLDLTANVPLFYKRNQGIGYRGESGTLPTAQKRLHKYSTVALAYLYGSINVTGPSIAASSENATSFAKVVDNEVKGMVQGLKLEKNRTWWGDGSGALARITQATGSVTAGDFLTVDDASRLEAGMFIDTYSAKSAGSQDWDSAEIAQVDRRRNKISMTATLTPTQNYYIFREDSRGLYGMGIQGIVDGADSSAARIIATLQGITRSTDIYFDANVFDNGGTVRNISLSLIQQAFEAGEIMSQGKTKLIISGYEVRRQYVDLLVADRRYTQTMKLSGGWSGLEYIGGGEPVAWVVDPMAIKKSAYFIDTDTFAVYRKGDFNWMDLDGAVLRKVPSKDEYEATAYCYLTLGCDAPAKSSVIRDISS